MARVTHYDSLGVSRTATAEEIKAAYRKLVKRSHPDGGGTGGLFKTVQEAYEVLIDPVRRAEYDDQLAGGWPEESVASDSESGARRHPRGRQSSGGAQSFNAYSDIGKPHFRIEPPSVMAEVIVTGPRSLVHPL